MTYNPLVDAVEFDIRSESPVPDKGRKSTGGVNMTANTNQTRRNLLKLGSIAVAMIPVAALAAKNDAMRTAMKYKGTPEGDKQCSNCMHFVAGKAPADLGGCKLFPNDTEVSPKGFCTAWAKKP
jgi:hypothetical protein